MSLEPEQLSQMLGATSSPAATLAFEASVDAHLDVLFNCSAAGTYGSDLASNGTAQMWRDGVPGIDAFAVAQDVTKECAKFEWASLAIGAVIFLRKRGQGFLLFNQLLGQVKLFSNSSGD